MSEGDAANEMSEAPSSPAIEQVKLQGCAGWVGGLGIQPSAKSVFKSHDGCQGYPFLHKINYILIYDCNFSYNKTVTFNQNLIFD
ncbi:hypothetical protein IPH25_03975 [bacterium]|nr:MAG: hypothetical protein IPG37_00970 [bacterium]QQR61607.1 MAG: hypothetical protein IPH25_03975 [bacterium]QQR62832.1 MAG: hypothetical protein IPH67_05515 [bacterium]